MKNRQLDVTLQSAGLGVSSLRDLATSVDIVVVPIPADVVQEDQRSRVPAGVDPRQHLQGSDRGRADGRGAATTWSRTTASATTSSTQMTKALWTNLDQLVAAHSAAKAIDAEARARRHAAAAASRRREVLHGSRPDQVVARRRAPAPARQGESDGQDPENRVGDGRRSPTPAFDETGIKRELTGARWRWSRRRRAGVLDLPALHRRVQPAVERWSRARCTSASCWLLAFLIHPVSARARPPPHRRAGRRAGRARLRARASTTGCSRPS